MVIMFFLINIFNKQFIVEHWRAKEHLPPQLKHEKSHSRHLTPFHSRANEESCVEICRSGMFEILFTNRLIK